MGKNEHNRWLHWKIEHGLATRGRTGDGPMYPKGLLGGLLYKFYYKKLDIRPAGPRQFEQDAGGSVGPSGTCNGE